MAFLINLCDLKNYNNNNDNISITIVNGYNFLIFNLIKPNCWQNIYIKNVINYVSSLSTTSMTVIISVFVSVFSEVTPSFLLFSLTGGLRRLLESSTFGVGASVFSVKVDGVALVLDDVSFEEVTFSNSGGTNDESSDDEEFSTDDFRFDLYDCGDDDIGKICSSIDFEGESSITDYFHSLYVVVVVIII